MSRVRKRRRALGHPRKKAWGGQEHIHAIDLMEDGAVLTNAQLRKVLEGQWAKGGLVNPVRKAQYKTTRIIHDDKDGAGLFGADGVNPGNRDEAKKEDDRKGDHKG